MIVLFQVSTETTKSADQQSDTVSEHAQLEKLERLEQEYLRLTRTQNSAEVHTETQFLHRTNHTSVSVSKLNKLCIDE